MGDTVRMRLINAGAAVHPMHLHGFYFNVDSHGDERDDDVHPPGSSARMVVTLLRGTDGNVPLAWRALSKDGMDLPGDQQVQQPSEIQMGNGETYDFDFVAPEAGAARLDVTAGNGTLLASMPMKVW